jgi:hypothetical protein
MGSEQFRIINAVFEIRTALQLQIMAPSSPLSHLKSDLQLNAVDSSCAGASPLALRGIEAIKRRPSISAQARKGLQA